MGSRGNPTLADVSNDFLVGEEYWDLLGGKGTRPFTIGCLKGTFCVAVERQS